MGAALADDEGAAGDEFTGKNLDSQALSVGISPVLRAA
jgi:hypothetical protein